MIAWVRKSCISIICPWKSRNLKRDIWQFCRFNAKDCSFNGTVLSDNLASLRVYICMQMLMMPLYCKVVISILGKWAGDIALSLCFCNSQHTDFSLAFYLAAPGLICGTWTLSCGTWDLFPWPGVEHRPPALGVRSLSHWITRKIPRMLFLREVLASEEQTWN